MDDCRQPDARIVNLALDDLAQLDPKLFFDTINSSALHVYSFSVGPTVESPRLHNFDVCLNHALGRDSFGLIGRLLQYFLQEPLVGSHGDHAYLSSLPQVLMIDFRNGNVKLRAQPVLQAAYDHPLVFQGMRMRYVDIEREQRDD